MWFLIRGRTKAVQNLRNSQFYDKARKLISLTLQGKTSAKEIEASLLTNNFARVGSAKARVAEVNANSELHNILQSPYNGDERGNIQRLSGGYVCCGNFTPAQALSQQPQMSVEDEDYEMEDYDDTEDKD